MRKGSLRWLALCVVVLWGGASAWGDNPIILDQFTADPSARVFNGQMYLYPSHDIRAPRGSGLDDWFCMEDYHVFSSANLLDWQDHGVILTQTAVPWVDASSYSMWAPDCGEKDGKFYFYFPAQARRSGPATTSARARRPGSGIFRIGVAIGQSPAGPFTPQPQPIEGVAGIDPCIFTDRDGQAYLYYAMRRLFVVKLKSNMLEVDGQPQAIANLPTRGLIEGPFTFERNGIYYLTFPHVAKDTERLEYAMGKSPMGPFTWTGVIMDESASGCWTNHHSIVQYQGQWYLFYHDMDLSPDFDKNRCVRADYLTFNDDGTIQKVIPTLRGVGVRDARDKVQIDRYSEVSKTGTAVSFVDNANKALGWKITLSGRGAWVRYDRVDFGKGGLTSVVVQSRCPAGCRLEIRLDQPDSAPLARVDVGQSVQWGLAQAKLLAAPNGVHDLIVSLNQDAGVDMDWVSFR